VLLITPRVLRSDATRQPALTEFRGGTENAIGGGLVTPFTPPTEQTPPPSPSGVPGRTLSAPVNVVPPTPTDAVVVPVPQIPPPPEAAN